ncbi:MAG: CinA family protein [Clostridiales bacterium]|nr:CinA family protein [Clostridiales bacterium]
MSTEYEILDATAQYAVELLRSRGKKLALAESCTGGLIAKCITDVSGASSVFECGVVSYSDAVKHSLLGVKLETLEKYGAVSTDTAIEMARGVREISGADLGLSVTGIAGPLSDGSGKPVGCIYIAISAEDGDRCEALSTNFTENIRENNRLTAARKALDMVIKSL